MLALSILKVTRKPKVSLRDKEGRYASACLRLVQSEESNRFVSVPH